MSLRLILMRHAKSSWKHEGLRDHERPLNKRGRRDAPRIAARLLELGWSPDAVVSSDSQRTRETWARMSDTFPDAPVRFEPALYHAGLGELRASAAGWSPDWSCVLVLGHNPGWEEALAWLARSEEVMTTGNAALLRGEGTDWAGALQGDWTLLELLRPREPTRGATTGA